MPVCADPAAVLEQQVPMYHPDDEHRYIMVMGVGPEGSDGNYQSFAPFQVPIEYDYDVLDLKHIIQAQLGYEPDEINLRVAGDFRSEESKLGPIFGRWFKEGWHMQASVYPKGWKSALEKWPTGSMYCVWGLSILEIYGEPCGCMASVYLLLCARGPPAGGR